MALALHLHHALSSSRLISLVVDLYRVFVVTRRWHSKHWSVQCGFDASNGGRREAVLHMSSLHMLEPATAHSGVAFCRCTLPTAHGAL